LGTWGVDDVDRAAVIVGVRELRDTTLGVGRIDDSHRAAVTKVRHLCHTTLCSRAVHDPGRGRTALIESGVCRLRLGLLIGDQVLHRMGPGIVNDTRRVKSALTKAIRVGSADTLLPDARPLRKLFQNGLEVLLAYFNVGVLQDPVVFHQAVEDFVN
jgi:hypothetical protein